MLCDTIANFRAAATTFYAGKIVNGEYNPIYLDIATTGYQIQSQTLRIPDRYGIFSDADTSETQVAVVGKIIQWMCFWVVSMLVLMMWFSFHMAVDGTNPLGVGMLLLGIEVLWLPYLYYLQVRWRRKHVDKETLPRGYVQSWQVE